MVFLLSSTLLFSQKGEETNELIQKAKKELFVNPEQSLKITEYILRNYNSNAVLVQSNSILANYYFITGKYPQAVDNIMLAIKRLPQIEDKTIQVETLLQAVEIFNFLNLYEASREYLNMAKRAAIGNMGLENKLKNHELLYSKKTPDFDNFRRILKEIAPNKLSEYASLTKGTVATQMTQKFLDEEVLDSASFYAAKNISDLEHNDSGVYWRMIAEIQYAEIYFKNKDYQNATKILDIALEKENLFKSAYFQGIIYERLARNHLVLKNKEKYREFSQMSSAAANVLNIEKTLAVNSAFDKFQNQKTSTVTALQEKENRLLWILGIVALAIAGIGLFVRWYYNTRIEYASNIVNYIKLIKKAELKPETPAKLILKSNQRPKETDELLLSKLAEFENGNTYLSNDISLAQLAFQLDTNTKYLSEVINQYKEKNFNVYINELRIHYIVNKLKTDPIYLSYKVSYLAEECGFSTHSSFSAVFKNITGITPNVFIQFLTKDKIEEENLMSLN
ncbi:helix-turn-helix domain-containing protein [Flavobacterium terrisoli]|uniref:helix-turn-helix domain-containing protein n=1 Tax=Flavobacterium terrisoli TaxID=3242195 RepID=UPI002542F475|nr:AraC family transcriptional regulator [Flavobacterium buctense]